MAVNERAVNERAADGRAGDRTATGSGGGAVVDTRFTPIYRVLRVLVHWVNRIVFRTTIEWQGRVPEEGPVIVAPVHRSFIDFFVASDVTGRKLHYMGKDSLWDNPVLARILPSLGAFPVHRGTPDRESLRRAQHVLEAGEVLILFPEGTRRTGPAICDLFEGVAFLAARTGATVVPVGIGGSASVMPKGSRVPRPRRIHLVVGEPILPPERTGGGRVSRHEIHRRTESLASTLQSLYDRSVAAAGRY